MAWSEWPPPEMLIYCTEITLQVSPLQPKVLQWLSAYMGFAEVNLATKALEIALDPTKGFESIFLYQLERSLDDIVKNRLKLVCNAGALNVKGLALATQGIVRKHGANLKIAYVTGDDLLRTPRFLLCLLFSFFFWRMKVGLQFLTRRFNFAARFDELQKQGETFQHLEGGDNFASSWPQKPVSVNAYSEFR